MAETNFNHFNFPELKNDRLLRAARCEPVDEVPCWAMRQAGRYLPEYNKTKDGADFFKICQTPSLCCEITLQPIKRFEGSIDAAIIFSDILVIPRALGIKVEMKEQVGPYFPEPIDTPEKLAQLLTNTEPNIEEKLTYVYDSIRLTRHRLEGKVPLLGFCGAPWTLLAYMIEGGGSKTFQKSKTFLLRNKDVLAGAQGVQVFDSWAGEIDPSLYEKLIMPSLLSVETKLRQKLKNNKAYTEDLITIVFARNISSERCMNKLMDSTYNVISLDWRWDPSEAIRIRGNRKKALQGNMDPIILLGPKDTIEESVNEMVERFGTKDGIIINLGHGVVPQTDPEHLRFYFEHAKQCYSSMA